MASLDLDASHAFWQSDPTDDDLGATVEAWKEALRNPNAEKSKPVEQHIVGLTFFAPAEVQWRFILIAAARLEHPDHVAAFAAGPLEGFLGRFGDRWIATLETECETNRPLRHALKGVWQHRMSDAVYARVQALAQKQDS